MGGLLRTLTGWYLERSSEARRLGAGRQAFAVERDSVSEQLRGAQGELGAPQESSSRQTNILQRPTAESGRYRSRWYALRAVRMASSAIVPPVSASPPSLRDLYEARGYPLRRATSPLPPKI